MTVYIVLCDRPTGYNDCYETEIVDVFEYEQDAKEFANTYHNYRIEEWEVRYLGRN